MAKKKIEPFVISFGAEDYFLDRDLERAKSWSNRRIIQVSGEDIKESELVGICESNSMDGTPKVVILDDAQKIKGDKTLKAYIADRAPNDDSTVLVAIVRSEKCPEIWNQAAKKGKLIEHKKLKTWDSNNEVIKWIEGEARRLGLSLSPGISEALFKWVGPNLYRLSNELSKLLMLVGSQGKVGVEQLALVIAKSPTAEPFQVAEAAFAKDSRKAMNLLSTVYQVMGEDANVPLTFSLIRQAEKFVLARSLVDRQTPDDEVATALGMNPWRYKTQFSPVVQRHKLTDLIRHMARLKKLDVDVKSSARSKRTLVELTVMSIAV